MKLIELFKNGSNYDDFSKTGTEEEIVAAKKVLDNIKVSDDIKNKIDNINEKINILVLGAMWCPDCQVNVSGLEYMSINNHNIQVSIVEKEGNEDYFVDYETDRLRIPTIIIFDEDFTELGFIVEKPQVLQEKMDGLEEEQLELEKEKYLNGEYIEDLIKEVLDIIFD